MVETLLRFVHLSDTHYCTPDYDRPPSRFDPRQGTHALIQQVNALTPAPDFVLHTGDVAYDPYPEIYDEIKDVFSALTMPVYYVPGNHDHSGALQTVLMGREEIQVPLYHTQAINGVRFIYLDANDPDTPPPAGRVNAAQLDWLRGQLQADDPRPIVVAVHHPLLKTHFSAWYDEFMMTTNGDDVHEILLTAKERIYGVFYGHVHQNLTFYRDGLMYSAVPSSWTQFDIKPGQGHDETINALAADPGFNLVTLTTEGTIIQRYTYRQDA